MTVVPSTSSSSRPAVRAAIDIGTNSFHVVIARVGPGARFEVITREKESVRLGHGSGDMTELEPDAIDRGIAALRRFRTLAESHRAQITAVATSAVREAANREVFLRRARDEAGIDVQVISGVEEARLIHLGVLQAVPVFDRQHLVIDIGGGSTEFVIGKGDQVHLARSVKLGAIRLTDRFFPGGIVDADAVRDCREYVRSYLTPLAREVADWGFEVAVGSSGTVGALAGLIEHGRGGEPSRSLNNASFTAAELSGIVDLLTAASTPQERLTVPGLDDKRADLIVAGAVLLEQLFATLGITAMTVSEYALREGVLLDAGTAAPADAFHHLSDIRRDGVRRLVDLFEREPAHVGHATDLALRLFDGTRPLHGLGTEARDLLEAAGMLHNVGLFISHSAHHKHSYYVIRNSDQLVGFTDREIEIMALVARYHRKSDPNPKHAELAALSADDQHVVRVLAGVLRMGIALDRSHNGVVTDVRVALADHHILVTALVQPGADASLERYVTEQRKVLLSEALGRPIELASF